MALAVSALGLQGCATKPVAYGPIGPETAYGYKDRVNPDGSHTVLVVMPGHGTPAGLRAFFDRRSTELCPAGVERTNVFRVDSNTFYASAPAVYGGVGIGSRVVAGTELEGYVHCKPGTVAAAANP
jgi:hypothetical protein